MTFWIIFAAVIAAVLAVDFFLISGRAKKRLSQGKHQSGASDRSLDAATNYDIISAQSTSMRNQNSGGFNL